MTEELKKRGDAIDAAAADAAVKLVGANILPADSDVTYDMLDLSDRQRQTLRREQARKRSQQRIDQLRATRGQTDGPEQSGHTGTVENAPNDSPGTATQEL